MIAVDTLVWDYPEPKRWLRSHSRGDSKINYASGLERQSIVMFEGALDEAIEFLSLDGVRRSLVAYWYDLLLRASDAGRGSLHAKHHSTAAIHAILRGAETIGSISP
jgi:hypothetical protein